MEKIRYLKIEKSDIDEFEYLGGYLENGLGFIVVSNPNAVKSSASLDVHVGSINDPINLDGLAHFLEHMLFLGTKKYPTENFYNKFLSENGGSSNAFTSTRHTNYHFDVKNEAFEQAIDIFSQFFISPLFHESATSRELNAINSEHCKNLNNDSWRLMQLFKSTFPQSKLFNRFSTGNFETLRDNPLMNNIDIRSELLDFYKKYYSANIMTLCLVGKESVQDMVNIVHKYFSLIENHNVDVSFENNDFSNELIDKMEYYKVLPSKDINSLFIFFNFADTELFNKNKSFNYISHLIGHEAEGSILHHLKTRDLALNLSAGPMDGGPGFGYFSINIELTSKGLESINDIIKVVLQYINMLKNNQPQEWIYEECKQLELLKFRFNDKQSPIINAISISTSMRLFAIEQALKGPFTMQSFDSQEITQLINHLQTDSTHSSGLNCMKMFVCSQSFNNQSLDLQERWYKTQYSSLSIQSTNLHTTTTILDSSQSSTFLHLPLENSFLPKNLCLHDHRSIKDLLPTIILDCKSVKIWHKLDNLFKLPKFCIKISIQSLLIRKKPLTYGFVMIFNELFKYSLNSILYNAELAGIKFHIELSSISSTISINGYNEKILEFTQYILKNMLTTTDKIFFDYFETLKQKVIMNLNSFESEPLHHQAIKWTNQLLFENYFMPEEIIDSIRDLSLEDFKKMLNEYCCSFALEIMLIGQAPTEIELSKFIDFCKSLNDSTTLDLNQIDRIVEKKLDHKKLVMIKLKKTSNISSAVELYIQIDHQSNGSNVLVDLCCQILAEPCFDILRTQKQLGYIVSLGKRKSSIGYGIRVIIQSEKSINIVIDEITTFFNNFMIEIEKLTAEQFDKFKNALIVNKTEPPQKLSAEMVRFWPEIISRHYNFRRVESEVDLIKSLKLDEFKDFYKNNILFNETTKQPSNYSICCISSELH